MFSLYVLSRKLSEDDEKEREKLLNELDVLRKSNDAFGKNNEKMSDIRDELRKISDRNKRWNECICEKDLKSLFLQARRYFNDWYEEEDF